MWNDNWIPRDIKLKPVTHDLYQLGHIAVANFISEDGLS